FTKSSGNVHDRTHRFEFFPVNLLKRAKFVCYSRIFVDAGVAQLVEQLTCNQQVGGSIPFASSWTKYQGQLPPLGQVAEWLMAAVCKSAAPCGLRRFGSSPVHFTFRSSTR